MRGDGGFQDESEKLQDTGDWKQLTLFHQGQRDRSGCMRAPQTCEIISGMNEATGCKRGQVFITFWIDHISYHTINFYTRNALQHVTTTTLFKTESRDLIKEPV